jgi:histidinol-phosphate aminotransferase
LPDAFRTATERLKLVFLPNPNSPSGTLVSRQAIEVLADHLPCPVVVDEAYVDFADFSCIDLPEKNDKILVSRTLSKSYALAGLRFGFLVAQPQIIEQLVKVKDSYNCDALAIAAATAAIDDQDWLRENQLRILASRQRLIDGLGKLGFHVIPSQANFCWCTHPSQAAKPIYEGLKASRVLVRYMQYPGWGDGLRISVGTDGEIDALLGLLAEIVGGNDQ